MRWQDLVFGIGGSVFSLALLPSVLGDDKPEQWTSGLTAIVLWTFIPAFVSLRLWFAAATGTITASLWSILLLQVA